LSRQAPIVCHGNRSVSLNIEKKLHPTQQKEKRFIAVNEGRKNRFIRQLRTWNPYSEKTTQKNLNKVGHFSMPIARQKSSHLKERRESSGRMRDEPALIVGQRKKEALVLWQ